MDITWFDVSARNLLIYLKMIQFTFLYIFLKEFFTKYTIL